MRNKHVFFIDEFNVPPLIWWYLGAYSNSSPRLVHRGCILMCSRPISSSILSRSPAWRATIFYASISYRCISISTSSVVMRDEIHSGSPLVDHRGWKPGTVSAETDPISFFARRGKTRRSINSETNERWDAGFCTRRTAAYRDGDRTSEKRRGEREESKKGKRDCRGWPRPYRERVEPRKNHKSTDLPVTPRTWRLIRRRSTKTMKRIMLFE